MKTISLISAGLDSPIAAILLHNKGVEVIPLHFSLFPFYCAGSAELALEIFEKLRKKIKFEKLVVVPFGDYLKEVLAKLDEYKKANPNALNYQCVLCRKGMFYIADLLASEEKADSISTGEALGQKASQTLPNLQATSFGLKHLILRPLIALDKNEILYFGKKNKFVLEKHVGCCSAVPKQPVTGADYLLADKLFNELELKEKARECFEKRIELKKDFKKVLLNILSK